jgi:predicted metal-dependent hydrolase
MSEVLTVDDLIIDVRRSTRRKTIGVTVERNKALIVHLPEGVSLAEAEPLIRARLVWIHQKLADHSEEAPQEVFRRLEFVNGEGIHFLGRHYRLKLVDQKVDGRRMSTVRLAGEHLLFRSDLTTDGEKILARYYTRAARLYLNKVVLRWKVTLGVSPRPYVNVMDLGFRWGSCSADGTLNFHWRVMQLPPQVIDYLVVHELAHLKVPNHSPAFWQVIGQVLPDYERHRRWLKENGASI